MNYLFELGNASVRKIMRDNALELLS